MKDEKKRIEDLLSYKILDTPEDEELNEIVEIASVIIETPVALLTMVDDKRQWFKAKKGTVLNETRIEDSFCRFALEYPDEVLVIEDTLQDERVKDNLLVLEEPYVRFYAGAPLVTQDGNVLGTLCLIDFKPAKLTDSQKKGLTLLAKQAMNFLTARKFMVLQQEEITKSTEKLMKITENIPGTVFQLRKSIDGKLSFDFIKLGYDELPDYITIQDIKKDATIGFSIIDDEYRQEFLDTLEQSAKDLSFWSYEYKISGRSISEWHMVKAKPELQENGDIIWYGIFIEITSHIEYEEAMERMAFDISHVLRKPVANLMSLSDLIQREQNISEAQLKEYVNYIIQISDELNDFTPEINKVYENKKNLILKSSDKLRNGTEFNF